MRRHLRSLTRLPFVDILRAARRRDALLRCRRRLPAFVTIGALAALPGCVAVGGARHSSPPTLGRQLIDLKAALEAGAMTEAEYAEAKSRLLREDAQS